MATGVSAFLPLATRARAIFSRFDTPIRITIVPRLCASSFQSSAGSGFAGSSWPVRMVTCEAYFRCVTGMPTDAGTASALETPGTISTAMPAALRSRLLAAPAKEERVSPLEPHDDEVFLRPVDHQGLDLVLFPRVPAAEFPAVDLLGFFREGRKDLLAGQLVVEDDICRVDNLCRPLREEPRASRAGAHKVDFTGHREIPRV